MILAMTQFVVFSTLLVVTLVYAAMWAYAASELWSWARRRWLS